MWREEEVGCTGWPVVGTERRRSFESVGRQSEGHMTVLGQAGGIADETTGRGDSRVAAAGSIAAVVGVGGKDV